MGLLCGERFHPKEEKEKRRVGYTPTRRIRKSWACMFLMLKRTRYVFCFVLFFSVFSSCSFFFSSLAPLRRNTSEACGLPFQWSGVRAPQSQVFVFISTRINRLSGLFRDQDQVQLLWVGWGGGRIPPHVQVFFNKVAPISVMFFVPFLFFPLFSSSSLSIFYSVYCFFLFLKILL